MKDPVVQVPVTRKFNLGNYQSMDIGRVAVVGPDQSPEDLIRDVDKRILNVAKDCRKNPTL